MHALVYLHFIYPVSGESMGLCRLMAWRVRRDISGMVDRHCPIMGAVDIVVSTRRQLL
jgi:hypothetical protein